MPVRPGWYHATDRDGEEVAVFATPRPSGEYRAVRVSDGREYVLPGGAVRPVSGSSAEVLLSLREIDEGDDRQRRSRLHRRPEPPPARAQPEPAPAPPSPSPPPRMQARPPAETLPVPQSDQPGQTAAGNAIVVPVIEERLNIARRVVETGRVRIQKTVESTDQALDEPLISQTYDVERVPIDKEVPELLPARYEGETLVLPVLEEVLVVQKKLILKEEIRVTPKRREERTQQTHTVRREKVRVERVAGEAGQSDGR